jgi:hypothetical protein
MKELKMPNHCENNAVIEGPAKDIQRFWEATDQEVSTEDILWQFNTTRGSGPKSELRFSDLIPKPDDVDDWYQWCNDNWGTKWGDYDHHGQVCDGEWEEKAIHSSYITAWGPFSEDFFIRVSAMFPTLRIAVSYEEPGMDFSGWYSFYGGEQVGSFETTYGNLMEGAIRSLRDHCQEPEIHIESDEEYGRRVSALLEKEGGVS